MIKKEREEKKPAEINGRTVRIPPFSQTINFKLQ